LHTVYKALAPENVESIIAYCQDHTIQNGGLFEVYSDGLVTTIVVNSKDEPMEQFHPLGAFYCNFLGPGIISLEEQNSDHDNMSSVQNHIKAIKQTIDSLAQKSTKR
jgi:hypothetical protein